MLHLDGPTLAAIGALLVAVGGLVGSVAQAAYNRRKIKIDEATSEIEQDKVAATLVSVSGGEARAWMKEYREVLKEFGELTNKVNHLEATVTKLEGQVGALTLDNKELAAENKELRERLHTADRQIELYRDAVEGALTLFEASTRGKPEDALPSIAIEKIKEVMRFETALRGRTGPPGVNPPPPAALLPPEDGPLAPPPPPDQDGEN